MPYPFSYHPEFLKLLDTLDQRKYERGEIILQPSGPAGTCFIIQSGLVKAYYIDREGEKEIRYIYGKREMFPLSWIVQRPNPEIYFEAMSDCIVRLVATDELHTLLQSRMTITYSLLSMVAEQFLVFAAQIDNLEYKYARERLAYRLLLMAYRFGDVSETDGVVLLPHISQQELGGTIRLARESVNRELHRFERLGVISFQKGRIVLLDQYRLRREISTDDEVLYFDA